MSQQEVIDFLSKHPNGWLSSKQIAEMMNTDPNTLCISLKKLRRWNHVLSKPKVQRRNDMSKYVYQFKED